MINIKELAKTLISLTTEETIALATELKDTYGLTPNEPQIITTEKAEIKSEEKTKFNIILNNAGPQKLQVVKEFNTISSIGGLMKSKEIIEAGGVIKSDVTKADAEAIKIALEAQGAEIVIE